MSLTERKLLIQTYMAFSESKVVPVL